MLTVALTSALLAKFVELKYNEQATMICLVNVVVMVLQVAIGWSWRQDYSHARTEAAARLLQIVWRFRRKGVMLWSHRRRMDRADCIKYMEAIASFKRLRLKHLESMVQGEGGYKLVMERIQQVVAPFNQSYCINLYLQAEEAFHEHVDELETSMDECVEEMMRSNVRQLTKMEEMQGTVLNANFETLNKYFIHIEKKMRMVNNESKSSRQQQPDD